MLYDQFAEQQLVCNVSVSGSTGTDGLTAFRGDLVIEEGEIADSQGRRLPPKSVLKQTVALAKSDQLIMVAGAVDDLVQVPEFITKYAKDFDPTVSLLFYVANVSKGMKIAVNGINTIIIPHDEGSVWTMLMDDLRLEKSDFKGQSAEDKVITMFEGLSDFSPKYDDVSYNDALGFIVDVKREARGAV